RGRSSPSTTWRSTTCARTSRGDASWRSTPRAGRRALPVARKMGGFRGARPPDVLIVCVTFLHVRGLRPPNPLRQSAKSEAARRGGVDPPRTERMLVDSFGRHVSDLRVSLTDRCNFACVYCHNEGLGDTRGPGDPAQG